MLDYATAIGIDIGHNSLKIAAVKSGGEIIALSDWQGGHYNFIK